MRKQKIILVLFLTALLFQAKAPAQNCVSENFPLKVGNTFVFKSTLQRFFPPSTSTTYFRTTITKDTVVNTRRYFFMNNYSGYQNKWWRVDSISGNVFVFDVANSCPNYNQEKLFDSLCVNLGDSVKGCGIFPVKCGSTSDYSIFNVTNSSRSLDYYYNIPGVITETGSRRYVKGFGLISEYNSSVGGGGGGATTIQLIGCIINGTAYGDSVSTFVNLISGQIPDKFNLHQNYPNPFNPSTVIHYQLSAAGFTTLKVFDLQGKEVASLVNEKQSAGSYAVDFNSSEYNLPSGIYFYTLNAGEFKETRKMILVK